MDGNVFGFVKCTKYQFLVRPIKHLIEVFSFFLSFHFKKKQVNMVDITRLNKSSFSAEESGQDALENTFTQKHKELSVLLLEMKEVKRRLHFLRCSFKAKGQKVTLSSLIRKK